MSLLESLIKDAEKKDAEKKERYGHQDRSLISKMGFQDNDLKSNTHDKMFCSLLDSHAINTIVNLCTNKEINWKWDINPEFPIVSRTGYNIGFIDIMVKSQIRRPNPECGECSKFVVLMIEIKTSIESIGELLRQINLYKQYSLDSVNPYDDKYNRKYTSEYGICFIVVSQNVTDEQRKILSINGTYLVDFKDVQKILRKEI